MIVPATEPLYLAEQTLERFVAIVVAVDATETAVALDRTAFYPTGGGQPHDTGTLTWGRHPTAVTDVTKKGAAIWHRLDVGPDGALPTEGDTVNGVIDWDRRERLMRTHTAMHVLCGVIWNEYGVPVTGGNMEPLRGRMDFEFDPLPGGFAARIEDLVNAEIAADRAIAVTFLPRGTALADADLIRTKVNLIPESVTEIRVVDIVGLDKQADGGTHVASTAAVGRFVVTKTESKGKGNKRIRFELEP